MRGIRRVVNKEQEDLDLAPMLAMIVSLIPILLMAFSFYHTSVVKTQVPQPAIAKSKKQDVKLRASLEINKNREMQLVVKRKNKVVSRKRIKSLKGVLNFGQLQKSALSFRKKYPEVLKLEIMPNESMSYQEIIEVIDHVKAADSKTELFSEVVFGNIFKG